MSISHRTNRLKLVGQPSVEQLQNGRYRLTVTCSTINSREDWYSANKDRIFPDFGSLQSAEMSIDGLAPREGEAYTDMRLTKVESGNRSVRDGGDYLVVLTYETLGSAFVQVKDDNTDYELNGLRRVTRTSIAEAGTDYDKTVGTSFIDHQIDSETAVRCYLASYSVDDTDSFRQVQEVYIEPGILSLEQSLNNGRSLVSVNAFAMTAGQVSGELSEVTDSHELISQNESDYSGIKTSIFEYQIDESFTEDYELNGLKRITLLELSLSPFSPMIVGGLAGVDPDPPQSPPPNIVPIGSPVIGLYLGTQDIDNGGAVKVRESLWLQSGTLKVSSSNLSEGVKQIETTFLVTEGSTVGPVLSKTTDNFSGLNTITVTTLQDKNGESVVKDGSHLVNRYQRLVDFTYPGKIRLRQDIITSVVGVDPNILNFELSPPVQAKVPATVSVIFQLTSQIQDSDYNYSSGGDRSFGYWNPTQWAKTYVSGIGHRYTAFSQAEGMRGYRTDVDIDGIQNLTPGGSNTFVSNGVVIFSGAGAEYIKAESSDVTDPIYARIDGVSDGGGRKFTVAGKRLYGSTPFIMQVSGGPPDPSNVKYVLDIDVVPAFETVDGVQVYKKTIVTSTIPRQGVGFIDDSNVILQPPVNVNGTVIGSDIFISWDAYSPQSDFVVMVVEAFNPDPSLLGEVFYPDVEIIDRDAAVLSGTRLYRLRFLDISTGDVSPWVSLEVSVKPGVEYPIPDPENITSTPNGSDTDWAWTTNISSQITPYTQIYKGISGFGQKSLLADVPYGTLSYTEVNAETELGTFDYTFQLINPENGDTSNLVNISRVVDGAITAPTFSSITISPPSDLVLNWTNNQIIAGSEIIIERYDGSAFVSVATVSQSGVNQTYTDLNAVQDGTITYKITASSSSLGVSAPSYSSITIGPNNSIRMNRVFSSVTGNDDIIEWDEISGTADIVEVQANYQVGGYTNIGQPSSSSGSFTNVNGQTGPNILNYRLRAINTATGGFSAWKSVATPVPDVPLTAPTNFAPTLVPETPSQDEGWLWEWDSPFTGDPRYTSIIQVQPPDSTDWENFAPPIVNRDFYLMTPAGSSTVSSKYRVAIRDTLRNVTGPYAEFTTYTVLNTAYTQRVQYSAIAPGFTLGIVWDLPSGYADNRKRTYVEDQTQVANEWRPTIINQFSNPLEYFREGFATARRTYPDKSTFAFRIRTQSNTSTATNPIASPWTRVNIVTDTDEL